MGAENRDQGQGQSRFLNRLRDETGRVAFEQSARPADNAYPTTQWDEGEVLLDWHDLTIPNSLAAGEYQIFVVLRQAETQKQIGEARLEKKLVVR